MIRFVAGKPIPMYGNTVEELHVEISHDGGETWTRRA